MPINEAEFQVRGIRDPLLAVHATGGRPAWLWANDGTRILWANPAGVAVFGAHSSSALAKRTFGPADQHRRQIARMAGHLSRAGAPRLERLRGFGMSLGQLLTCACTRLVFTGGGIGVLVVALDPVGRTIPYEVRLKSLVDDIDAAVVAFTPTGSPAAANAAAAALLSSAPLATGGLAPLGLAQAGQDALRIGHAESTSPQGRVDLHRVGQGHDLALIAIITPPKAESEEPPAPATEAPDEPVASHSEATPPETESTSPVPPAMIASEPPVAEHTTHQASARLATPDNAHPATGIDLAPLSPSVAEIARQVEHVEDAWPVAQPSAPQADEHVQPATEAPASLEPTAPQAAFAPPAEMAWPSAPVPPIEARPILDTLTPPVADVSAAADNIQAEQCEPQTSAAQAHEPVAAAADVQSSQEEAALLASLMPRAETVWPSSMAHMADRPTKAASTPSIAAAPEPVNDINDEERVLRPEPAPTRDHSQAAANLQAAAEEEALQASLMPRAETMWPSSMTRVDPLPTEDASAPAATAFTEPVDNILHAQPASHAPAAEASEPSHPAAIASTAQDEPAPPASAAPHAEAAPPSEPQPQETPLIPRRHPLRFMWQMDADGRFALGSDEFSRLIGPRTATAFGRPWSDIAEVFGLDPSGRVAAALATRDTWSGVVVHWPADGDGTRLPVELSGLPIYDRTRQFQGYRGFGVCRDLDALARLAELRRHDALLPAQPLHAAPTPASDPHDTMDTPMTSGDTPPPPSSHDAALPAPSTETNTPVDTPQNVVPFRPATDLKTPTLTPVENNAFNELARQLAARLETERRDLDARDEAHEAPSIAPEGLSAALDEPDDVSPAPTEPVSHRPAPPQVDARRDTLLYDRMPVGVLIYRLDRLLYANKAFLARIGHVDLPALTAAGGLDALYVEPGVGDGDSSSEQGAPVTIAATGHSGAPTEARLHRISWDGEDAHALIFTATASPASQPLAPPVVPAAPADPAPATSLEAELGTILDATDDGILIFDQDGNVVTCNRGAEVMFGYGDRDIVRCHLTDLFVADDRDTVRKAIATARGATDQITQPAHGLTRNGEIVPLRLTIGRSTANGERLFAIGRREASPRTDTVETTPAAPQPDRAAHARADILARISHEVRTPLNAVIGFADVMIEERFGALGNERYAAYLKDIRAAGERVLAIINDMIDLSRAETGKLDLTFARQDLNDMVEKCVTIMQPQANRERIIIRTSLAHALPPVTADADALRQIVLNLVGNSIHVARAGGQIIVSTALTDLGDVVLRIRDSGRAFSHAEPEAAAEPARSAGAEQVAQDNIGINLTLTKALVEANQGQFHIKATPQAGTLVEVAFSPKTARAV